MSIPCCICGCQLVKWQDQDLNPIGLLCPVAMLDDLAGETDWGRHIQPIRFASSEQEVEQ